MNRAPEHEREVEKHGGHGLGLTIAQRDAALADEYAFLLQHTVR